MDAKRTLSFAIAAILGLNGDRLARAQTVPDASSGSGAQIQEIVVTATRRSENLQDVPIAITALTGEALQQLNVQTFDDYVKYLPNVTTSAKGPGQNDLYMRGLATTHEGNQVSGGVGSFPNVALYLDDQSVQLIGRNLDVYAADLERIEVLEGPQGTLYGAGAQAGAIRYITNKPKLNLTEGGFTGGYSATAHGDPSNAVQGYLNLPLISDTLAIRAVLYDDARGGYIHNIPGTFARAPTDVGVVNYFGGVVPPNSATVSNGSLVNNAYNPVVYKGGRLSALYEMNDAWNLMLQQSYQSLEADGVFSYDPALGDLNVQQYNQSADRDSFEDTAWVLNGRIAGLKAVYTGGYLDRKVDQVTDYTAYSRGPYAAYYQCNGPALPNGTGATNICYSPSATWHSVEKNTHQSHELRLSSPDEQRIRALGGVFWEEYKIQSQTNFLYGDEQAGFHPYGPAPGIWVANPSVRPPGDVFFTDLERGYNQRAAFGEVAFDVIPKSLTLTVGTRFFHINSFFRGQSDSAYGCRNVDPCTSPPGTLHNFDTVTLRNGTKGPLEQIYTGHKNKVSLSWKPTQDALLYGTYSEGFRPGGFNHGTGLLTPRSPLYGKFIIPFNYDSDSLKNYELGWKTLWFNHRLQFNGAIYEEKWQGVQLQIYDPVLYGGNTFGANGPDYRVRGVEGDVVFRATAQLTLSSSFAWNQSEQVNEPSLLGDNGKVISLFPTAGIGSPLAHSPPFQGNIRARYEVPINGYNWFLQVAAQHTDHSYADVLTLKETIAAPDFDLPSYTTYDASVGIARDGWEVTLFGENLTDTRAQLFKSAEDWEILTTPNRPRVIGIRLSYRFGAQGIHSAATPDLAP